MWQTSAISAISGKINKYKIDLLIAIILSLIFGIFIFQSSLRINPIIFSGVNDIWFNSDTGIVLENMVDANSNYARNNVHPLFPLFGYLSTFIPRVLLNLDKITSARIAIAGIASIWISTIFILLRIINCKSIDAFLFSILAGVSSTSIFWFVVPETYSLGSISILSSILLVALSEFYSIGDAIYVLVNIFTLGMTITNGMAGFFATIFSRQWKQTLKILGISFALLFLFALLQKIFFKSSAVAAIANPSGQFSFASFALSGRLERLRAFIFHSIIMPIFQVVPNPDSIDAQPVMSIQNSGLDSGGILSIVAIICWTILLLFGLWALFNLRGYSAFRFTLGFTLLGQMLLHLVHGNETFLYSLHYAPLLVILSSLISLTKFRIIGIGLVSILITSVAINNISRFNEAVLYLQNL